MNVKKVLAVASVLVGLTVFGAADDKLISFSTPGPDKYADGTQVLDGECYALVWTKTGTAFGGIAADGTAVGDSKVLVFAPVAKGGRCPTVVFEVDATIVEALGEGSFGVYLLDTRLADGKVGGLNVKGVPVAVNGYGATATTVARTSDAILSLATGTNMAAAEKSAVPEGTPQPRITALRVIGEKVYISVTGTVPYLQYAAKEVLLSDAPAGEPAKATQGGASAEAEITLILPKKTNGALYRIERK